MSNFLSRFENAESDAAIRYLILSDFDEVRYKQILNLSPKFKNNNNLKRFNTFLEVFDVFSMSFFKKNWTLDETEKLIEIVRLHNTLQPVGNKKYRSIDAFDIVSKELAKFGYIRSAEQIRGKIKCLKRDFSMAAKKPLRSATAECPHFEQLKEIFPPNPDYRFVQVSTASSDVEDILESVPLQECKKTRSLPLHTYPRKKRRPNTDNSTMSFMKDLRDQQNSSSKSFIPVKHNKAEKMSSDEDSFERDMEPYLDLHKRKSRKDTEYSNLNFLKSLLPDLNKLSESSQRIFKQRALVHLYKLLEDEEADKANMKEDTYDLNKYDDSTSRPQMYIEQSDGLCPDQSTNDPITVELKIDKIN